MADRKGLKSRRGVSLVEEVCAAAVLTVTVLALVGTIGFAHGTVLKSNTSDGASAQAQEIADSLITAISSSQTPDTPDLSKIDADDMSASGFADGHERQFTIVPAYDASGNIAGYNITVRVYYNGGKDYAQMTAYASGTGGAFNS